MQKIKILFDARYIKNPYSGIARYIHLLLVELIKNYSAELKISILLNRNTDYSNNYIYSDLVVLSKTYLLPIVYLNAPHNSVRQFISFFFYKKDYDIFFCPHYDVPFPVTLKTLFVVHDLNPVIQESYFVSWNFIKKRLFNFFILKALKHRLTRCVTISGTTKMDMLHFMGEKFDAKIDVIPSGLSLQSQDKSHPIKLPLTDKPFLFYIGDRRPHKNLKKMIDVFLILREVFGYDGYFLIAGNILNYDIDIDLYTRKYDSVILLGNVSESELSWLYQHMDALFFLTKYEGFGLPIVEAAYFAKKMIVSNTGSANEISPKSALKLDPLASDISLAGKIFNYLSQDIFIDNFDYLQFYSWSRAAADYRNLMLSFSHGKFK